MKTTNNLIRLLAIAMLFSGTSLMAQDDPEPCYPTTVVDFSQGLTTSGQPVTADRSDENQALGQPDASNAVGGFVSLGVNGSITLEFPGNVYDMPGPDLMVFETSFSGDNCGGNDDEHAQIELSPDGVFWVDAGTICRDGVLDLSDYGLDYILQIRITSVAPTSTSDGYDVDGVVAVNGCGPFLVEEGCYGQEVLLYNPGPQDDGTPITEAERLDPTKALGAPQQDFTYNFVSLGYGGELIIGFDGAGAINGPGDDLLVAETTFDAYTYDEYPESADVYISPNGGDFYLLGEVRTNEPTYFDFDASGFIFDYIVAIKFIDTTPDGSISEDGYDVDGVVALNGCQPFLVEEGCYVEEVLLYNPGPDDQGNALTNPLRIDPTKALGAPQMDDTYNFVSLGYGGELILGFDGAGAINGPGDDILISETTFNGYNFVEYPESCDVYISPNGADWYLVGSAQTNELTYFDFDVTFPEAGVIFDYIVAVKVVDTTPAGSISEDGYDVDGIVALHGCEPGLVVETPCEGTWRTQTMGGWGQPGNGNNTGAYRDANFASNFPNGLVVGCEDGYTHTLTTAAAVEAFLPSGGPSTVFNMDRTDHTQKLGAFAGNLTALALTVGSDNEDPDFNTGSDFLLQDLIVQSGLFQGWTVGAVLAEANEVIGGCSTDYTPQQMNTIVDAINNAYTDGIDNNNGLLGCPDAGPAQSAIAPSNPESTSLRLPDLTVTPNPNAGNAVISFEAVINERVTLEVVDMSGRTVVTLYNQELNPGQLYRFDFNGQYLPNGIYIAKLSGSNYVITEKVMIAR